jgi:hypothetical protein
MNKTKYGHQTVELTISDSEKYPKEEIEPHYPIRYSRSEYNHQIEKLEKLGINVNAQTFEQCVNTLLYLYENKIYLKDKKQ